MRQILLIAGLVALPLMSLGQVNVPKSESYYAKYFKPIKTYYFYIDLAASIPRGKFGDEPSIETSLLDPWVGNDGLGGGTGLNLDLGFRFPMGNPVYAKNTLYPTFNFGAALLTNPFDFSNINPDLIPSENITLAGLDLGVGLALNVGDKWVLEGNFEFLIPLYNSVPSMTYSGSVGNHFVIEEGSFLDMEEEKWPFHLGRTIGLGIRIQRFKLFMEWFYYKFEAFYDYNIEDSQGEMDYHHFNAKFDVKTLKTGVSFIF